MAGSGIDLITSNQKRRIFGVHSLTVSIYLNLNDPKNYNKQISGLALQNAINNVTNNVNVNTLDISTLDTTVSSWFLARYTKLESDVRYYTKTEISSDTKNICYILNGGTYTYPTQLWNTYGCDFKH